MTKWEYNALVNLRTNWMMFKALGEDGWELVGVDGGIGYFKRPMVQPLSFITSHKTPKPEVAYKPYKGDVTELDEAEAEGCIC